MKYLASIFLLLLCFAAWSAPPDYQGVQSLQPDMVLATSDQLPVAVSAESTYKILYVVSGLNADSLVANTGAGNSPETSRSGGAAFGAKPVATLET